LYIAGRYPKYQTLEELASKIDEYFNWCDKQCQVIKDDKGTKTIKKPYTISGLCLYLDITRETLCEYQKLEVFSDTIKKAKHKVENYVEENSLNGNLNPTVSIFNLKNNFGWKDKQEIEQLNVNLDKSDVEELKRKIAEYEKTLKLTE
jgi:hypothetical protein